MEPWLDSLSEDWKSEASSSSPSSRSFGTGSKNGSAALARSHSRIPHLSQDRRRDLVNARYLQPRSTRGLGRSKTSPILTERSPSSLNVVVQAASSDDVGSQKRRGAAALSLRASSAFSESQQSVRHNTMQHSSDRDGDIPEWKRRLAGGEDVSGEGIDLFGPSKLEGIFMRPTTNVELSMNGEKNAQRKPWTPFNLPTGSSPFEQQQSTRTSRGRLPNMEVLREVNEEENSMLEDADIESSLIRKGSLRGLVKNRVQSLERVNDGSLDQASSLDLQPKAEPEERGRNDSRWRTTSGQEELRNEEISPVTVSKQNTIRDHAVRDTLERGTDALQSKLESLNIQSGRRPSSSSSDRSVQYGLERNNSEIRLHDESLGDFTSHSLPEDLSMGTQEFVTKGGFVNRRRGGYSRDASFQHKQLSSSSTSSRLPAATRPIPADIRSSPPPYTGGTHITHDSSRLSNSAPVTPHHHRDSPFLISPDRPHSSGSPLKLFGDRDTYTNNKLLRVLSQFEEVEDGPNNETGLDSTKTSDLGSNFLMSHFGRGELNDFSFEQSIVREEPLTIVPGASIFQTNALTDMMEASGPGSNTKSRPAGTLSSDCVEHIHSGIVSARGEVIATHAKRTPNSPLKQRTPKRRRTLLRDENDFTRPPTFVHVEEIAEVSKLAGTKRKDSRAAPAEPLADPDVLASRTMLRPIKAKQQSLGKTAKAVSETEISHGSTGKGLTEALAAELASFTNGVAQAANDSRKPSVTTKDYMEEANKVMQFIRAKGKPKTSLSKVAENNVLSEPSTDPIVDLDMDPDSTRDSFSRPPSREGPRDVPRDRRHVEHDPLVASYLRKYQDQDDFDLLASTSALGAFHLTDNQVPDAALEPLQGDEQASEPSNIRIRNHDEHQRKRKHSTSSTTCPNSFQPGTLQTQNSSGNSTRHTFPTGSSGSSGRKGMITSGTVAIPDQVGTMKFDHATKTWVKDHPSQGDKVAHDRRDKQRTSEEDPFESIPDLSIEEQEERFLKSAPQRTQASKPNVFEPEGPKLSQNSLRSEVSEHELRILNGEVSRPPKSFDQGRNQPRVVTIAFSSPVVSAAYPREPNISELEDDTDSLPLDDSDLALSSPASSRDQPAGFLQTPLQVSVTKASSCHDAQQALAFTRRPVSRIEEHEEDNHNGDMSVVHFSNAGAVTPGNEQSHLAMSIPGTANKASNIMCLTPLSEFSLHQVDRARNPDHSYVEERAHPNSLRQAHGSLALAVDDLIKAVTDAEPCEPFWENVRRLNLTGKSLSTMHGLREYFSTLEELSLGNNQIGQLGGLPPSLRTLSIQENCLSSLTSWGHLQNLQYVNVSNNQLESLDGFSSLVHLRDLDASHNCITDIRGVFDLTALLSLRLGGNRLNEVDFEGAELIRLTGLDLSCNGLVSVRGLGSLPLLEELSLDNNNLQNFSATNNSRLRGLSLSNNELSGINLADLPALERLYLDRNRIISIGGLANAHCLDTLSLREQTDSPDIVSYIMSTSNECENVYLSLNAVSGGRLRLPERPHYNLLHLEMACCGISSLPQDFGDYVPNCRTLNLNFNAVEEISPLLGMIKLRKLLLARNRIKRLRRTCLVLRRLKTLAAIDLRDNPLTVGFYAPLPTAGGLVVHSANDFSQALVRESYVLEPGAKELDEKWLRLLDEITGLRRWTIWLLLAETCGGLVELDGLAFERNNILRPDHVWKTLTEMGVLKKTTIPSEMWSSKTAAGISTDTEQELSLDVGDEKEKMIATML